MATGGAGFIGSHLVDALIARGCEVAVVDDLSTGEPGHVNVRAAFHHLDVRSPSVAELVREWRPDVIFHLAAQMSVSRSVREPMYDADVNVRGSLLLLEAAKDVDARVVFASCGGAIYGDAPMLPTPETCPPRPVSPCAVSKLAVEHYLRCYRARHGLFYSVLRYGNVYGPRGEAGAVAVFCDRVLQGRQVVIHGDGRCSRDYVYVDDVVEATLAALDNPVVGHFNVATGRQTDVNRLFQLMADAAGVVPAPVYGPARPGDVRASALDCRLIAAELGWRPRVRLEEGLARTLAWFRERSPAAAAGR